MITSVDVFKEIKLLSVRKLNPRHHIAFEALLPALTISKDSLLVLLIELENRGLIKVHRSGIISVSLTDYGAVHDNPPGGIDSREL